MFLTVDHITGPVLLEQYVAIADYKKQNRNEVNMVAGDIVEVIDKNENGTANIVSVRLYSGCECLEDVFLMRIR